MAFVFILFLHMVLYMPYPRKGQRRALGTKVCVSVCVCVHTHTHTHTHSSVYIFMDIASVCMLHSQ